MQRPALTVAGAIFALVSLVHWVRVFAGTEIVVGGTAVPVWLSLVAGIVLAALAAWMVVAAARRG